MKGYNFSQTTHATLAIQSQAAKKRAGKSNKKTSTSKSSDANDTTVISPLVADNTANATVAITNATTLDEMYTDISDEILLEEMNKLDAFYSDEIQED